ncbi:MAG: nucleoside phosphorylase [Brevinema sp.]
MNNFPTPFYNKEKEHELVHHLKLSPADIGHYVLMPGDPKRCESIAAYLDNAELKADFREYTTYTGTLEGVPVSVVSHGIGGASTAIAVEELIKLGAHTFIRIGTSGGMQLNVIPGEVVIVDGAIRADNTPNAYLPYEIPAVPSFDVLEMLEQGAIHTKTPYHIGVVHCKDAFYAQHSPETMAMSEDLIKNWNAYIRGGAIASEMESSTLFAIAQSKGVRAGAAMLILANQERRKQGMFEFCHDTDIVVKVVIEGLRLLIQKDSTKITDANC